MNWWEIWSNALAAMEAEPDITEVMGDAIFLEGDREIVIPCINALLVVNTEEEVFAPAEWQFDLYTRTIEEVVQVEKAMMRLFNQPLYVVLGDARFTSELIEGTLLRGPYRDPYFRRQLEFRFTPVRSRYYRPSPAGES